MFGLWVLVLDFFDYYGVFGLGVDVDDFDFDLVFYGFIGKCGGVVFVIGGNMDLFVVV